MGLLGKAMVLAVVWVFALVGGLIYYWLKGDLAKPPTKDKAEIGQASRPSRMANEDCPSNSTLAKGRRG